MKGILDKKLLRNVLAMIADVKVAQRIDDIRAIKKLVGLKEYYRIRIGDFRVGIKVIDDTV